MHKNALKRVTDFLEYIFIFVIIAECNSYFGRSTGADRSMDMSTLLLGLSAGLLVVLLALHLVSDVKALAKLRRLMPLHSTF